MAGDRDLSKQVIFEKKTQGIKRIRDSEGWEEAHQAWKNGEKRPRGRNRLSKRRGEAGGKGGRQVKRKSGPVRQALL